MSGPSSIDQVVIDRLWDFDDFPGSEQRFRRELSATSTQRDQDLVRTQLARAVGAQSRFDEAAAMLMEIESDDTDIGIRVLIESGRIMNGSGNPDVAVALFRQAASIAAGVTATVATGSPSNTSALFLQIDALHMLALSDSKSNSERHDDSGLAPGALATSLASGSSDPRIRRFLIGLHSDIGWRLLESGAAISALDSFTEAERQAHLFGTADEKQWTKVAVADCRKLLGVPREYGV